jgi:hypothetical protein
MPDMVLGLYFITIMPRGDSYDLQGQGGGQVYNAGSSAVGPFRWVQFVNDTILSAISAPNLQDSGSKLIAITIPAGFGLGGTINSFTVTSGVVIGYRA